MNNTFFETNKLPVAATEQLETKMNKVKCNDKETEIVKEENEESSSLIPFTFFVFIFYIVSSISF